VAKRVGAKSIGAINQTTRKALNDGVLESASLSEALSIDFSRLMSCAFPQMNAHAELKDSPHLGEPLVNRVMEDPSRYVQNSCANWLNDAGKTQPLWVTSFCEQWQSRGQSEALTYVIRRALRNIE